MNVYEQIVSMGFLTGSQTFGTQRPDSDFDIVTTVDKASELADLLEQAFPIPCTREASSYFSGSKYTWWDTSRMGTVTFNIVPLPHQSIEAWYLTTLAMSVTFKRSNISSKIVKYGLFESMVASFKLAQAKAALQPEEFDAICKDMSSYSTAPNIGSAYRRLRDVCRSLSEQSAERQELPGLNSILGGLNI